MAGASGLAVISLVAYFVDGRRELALGAVVAGLLAASGVTWASRLTTGAFEISLVADTVVLAVWAWLMGGLALGVAAILAWVVLAAALALGPEGALRFTALGILAVLALGLAHLLFDTVEFNRDRVIVLNLLFSCAVLVPIGLLT